MAIDDNADICRVDIGRLQKVLEAQNVMIHFDDKLVPLQEMEDVNAGADGHI